MGSIDFKTGHFSLNRPVYQYFNNSLSKQPLISGYVYSTERLPTKNDNTNNTRKI